jgi:hypothetical protein
VSDDEYQRDGWKPSWRPALGTEALSKLPDRDDLAEPWPAFAPTPVETTTGEKLRQAAIRIVGARVETLRERGRGQRLTTLEQRDLMDGESAIQTLRKMAPVGELLPARAGGLDQWSPVSEDITPWRSPE